MAVDEFGSVDDMRDWNSIQRYAVFKEGGRLYGYKGNHWSFGETYGWSRTDLTPKQTADFLAAVAEARVDNAATQRRFEDEIALNQKYDWKDRVIRWPRLEPTVER